MLLAPLCVQVVIANLATAQAALATMAIYTKRMVELTALLCTVEDGGYSAVGLKTVGFPLAGTSVFKQSPL